MSLDLIRGLDDPAVRAKLRQLAQPGRLWDAEDVKQVAPADNDVMRYQASSGLWIPGRIGTASLEDGAVTEAKLGSGSVTTEKLADQAVTSAKLADESVAPGKMSVGFVQRRYRAASGNQAITLAAAAQAGTQADIVTTVENELVHYWWGLRLVNGGAGWIAVGVYPATTAAVPVVEAAQGGLIFEANFVRWISGYGSEVVATPGTYTRVLAHNKAINAGTITAEAASTWIEMEATGLSANDA